MVKLHSDFNDANRQIVSAVQAHYRSAEALSVLHPSQKKERKRVCAMVPDDYKWALIALVKERPPLFDDRHHLFRNAKVGRRLWIQVKDELIKQRFAPEDAEKCRGRWNTLKTQFKTDYSRRKSYDAGLPFDTLGFPFYDELSFLLPHLHKANGEYLSPATPVGTIGRTLDSALETGKETVKVEELGVDSEESQYEPIDSEEPLHEPTKSDIASPTTSNSLRPESGEISAFTSGDGNHSLGDHSQRLQKQLSDDIILNITERNDGIAVRTSESAVRKAKRTKTMRELEVDTPVESLQTFLRCMLDELPEEVQLRCCKWIRIASIKIVADEIGADVEQISRKLESTALRTAPVVSQSDSQPVADSKEAAR